MQEVFKIISAYNLEITIGLMGSVVLLLISVVANAIRISKLSKKNRDLRKILEFSNGEAMEKSILEAISFRRDFEEQVNRIDLEAEDLKGKLSRSLQNIGFVRYNAFGDMGSDLSFSVALLDEKLDGVVITSIYGREDSSVYAKPVEKGESDYKLSVEEMQAIDRAIKSKDRADLKESEAGSMMRSKGKSRVKADTEKIKEEAEE